METHYNFIIIIGIFTYFFVKDYFNKNFLQLEKFTKDMEYSKIYINVALFSLYVLFPVTTTIISVKCGYFDSNHYIYFLAFGYFYFLFLIGIPLYVFGSEYHFQKTYYKRREDFELKSLFESANRNNKDIKVLKKKERKFLKNPINRLRIQKKYLFEGKFEDSKFNKYLFNDVLNEREIRNRKVGYKYELEIYYIFNKFEEDAYKNDLLKNLLDGLSKDLDVENCLLFGDAEDIVYCWRGIKSYNHYNWYWNWAKKNQKLDFLIRMESKYQKEMKPSKLKLLLAIQEKYSINDEMSLSIFDIWEKNGLIREDSDGLYSVGYILDGPLKISEKSIPLRYGKVIEISGGAEYRVTNLDISYKQWQGFNSFRYFFDNRMTDVFSRISSKRDEFGYEVEESILLDEIMKNYKFRKIDEAKKFLVEKWLIYGFVNKTVYCSYKNKYFVTYKITELYYTLEEHFQPFPNFDK